jgi:hypothetical protein
MKMPGTNFRQTFCIAQSRSAQNAPRREFVRLDDFDDISTAFSIVRTKYATCIMDSHERSRTSLLSGLLAFGG